jgi:hypothetical protein
MDWGYQSVANGLPDDEYTSYLRDTLKQSSSDIDGLTASRAKIRAEEDGLDAATQKGGAAGTLGAMLIPFLAGLAAPGGSDAMLGTAFSAAGKGGELYYNNLEADEKERRLLLNREIDATDKKMAAAQLSQERMMQNIGVLQEKRMMGQLPGTPEFANLQAAENAKWQNQQNYAQRLREAQDALQYNRGLEEKMASGTLKYDPRLPAQSLTPPPEAIGSSAEGGFMLPDGSTAPGIITDRPTNSVWAEKNQTRQPLPASAAALVSKATEGAVPPEDLNDQRVAAAVMNAQDLKLKGEGEKRRVESQAMEKERLDMAKSGRLIKGYVADEDANTDPVTVRQLSKMTRGVARLDGLSNEIVTELKRGGNSLVGDHSSILRALSGEFNLATKERSGPGAALTQIEKDMYFSAIPALVADPSKSWADVARQYGLNRDPVKAFEDLKKARHLALDSEMEGAGWFAAQGAGNASNTGNNPMAALSQIQARIAELEAKR